MSKEERVFADYLEKYNLKWTRQRKEILSIFLKQEKHLTVEEMYKIVHQKNPRIGYATIYRTLKLVSASGLARRVDFGEGKARFEHEYNHEHHDHLVCLGCGKLIEIKNSQIERLQNKLAEKHGFKPASHKMQIFGHCRKCRK